MIWILAKNDFVVHALLVALIIVSLFNFWLSSSVTAAIVEKTAELETAKPVVPQIQITVLSASSCADCFDISSALNTAKNSKTNVTEEKKIEFDSAEGKALIAKYGVKKIPTVIVTGEIDNATKLASFGAKANGAIVFDKQTPVYIDAQTGAAKGRVTAMLVTDKACSDCTDYAPVVEQLKGAGVKISDVESVDFADEEGKAIVKQYNLSRVPSIVLSSDLNEYAKVTEGWSNVGTIESDGSFVLRQTTPPFRDVAKDAILGRVSVVYLSDESCSQCYNASLHRPILLNFGLKLVDEKNVSISSQEGKDLVKKYNISAVPTILVSPDAKEYSGFMGVWAQVGSNETDGWLVFREIKTALQGRVYKDLSTGEIVGLTPSPTPEVAGSEAVANGTAN